MGRLFLVTGDVEVGAPRPLDLCPIIRRATKVAQSERSQLIGVPDALVNELQKSIDDSKS